MIALQRSTVLAALALGACVGQFDDLRASAWSDSEPKPKGLPSADFGIFVATVDRELPGATIIVGATDSSSLTTLSYDTTGRSTLGSLSVADDSFGDATVIVGADGPIPGGDGVFAVGGPATAEIRLFDARTGSEGPAPKGAISAADCDASWTTVGIDMAFGTTNVSGLGEYDFVFLADSDLVLITELSADGAPGGCFRCSLPGAPLSLTMADVSEAEGDEILVVVGQDEGPSRLIALDGASVQGADLGTCPASILGAEITGRQGEEDFGARMAAGDFDDEDPPEIALATPSSGKVYLIRNLTTSSENPELITISAAAGGVEFGHAVAFGDFNGDDLDELVISDPSADVESVPGAGRATLYALDGELPEVVGTLWDSTPEADQAFGRSLTVAEFISSEDSFDILVVGARNEVFTYFRALSQGEEPRE